MLGKAAPIWRLRLINTGIWSELKNAQMLNWSCFPNVLSNQINSYGNDFCLINKIGNGNFAIQKILLLLRKRTMPAITLWNVRIGCFWLIAFPMFGEVRISNDFWANVFDFSQKMLMFEFAADFWSNLSLEIVLVFTVVITEII